jgi:CheY-like chemotaxis protein
LNNLNLILIVEDDDNDVFLLERAFRKIGYDGGFHRCQSAPEAIAFLGRVAQSGGSPQLVITDIKMPGGSGFDLLSWIKENPHCMVVPTIVLSSSNDVRDVKNAYCLGANAFLKKPASISVLQQQIESLIRFWTHCEIPEPGVHSPCVDLQRHAA